MGHIYTSNDTTQKDVYYTKQMRCLWLFWALLTWLSTAICFAGALLPHWLKGEFYQYFPTSSDIGLFRRCVFLSYELDIGNVETVVVQKGCGHYGFYDVPHQNWKIALILMMLSCSLQFFLTFFITLIGFRLDVLNRIGVRRFCQIMQLLAGLLTVAACLLYPLGWHGNMEVYQICGLQANFFNPGRCHIGWGYVLTCSGGFIALMTTLLPAVMNGCCIAKQEDDQKGVKLRHHKHITLNDVASSSETSSFMQHPHANFMLRHDNATTNINNTNAMTMTTFGDRRNSQRYSYVSYQSAAGTHCTSVPNGGYGPDQMILVPVTCL